MECRHLTNDLIAEFERLAPAERELIESHVERCVPCHTRFDEVKIIGAALSRSTEAPPAALLQQLDAAVLSMKPNPAARRRRSISARTGWAFALASLAAGGIVAFLAWLDWTGRHRTFAPVIAEENKSVEKKREEPKITVPDKKEEPKESKKETAIVKLPEKREEPKPAPLPGDLNGDGRVDVADYLILMRALAASKEGLQPAADLKGDGVIDVGDLQLLARAILKNP